MSRAKVDIYVHTSKDSNAEKANALGLVDKAFDMFLFLGYEHKLTFDVDLATGEGELIAVDDRAVAEKGVARAD